MVISGIYGTEVPVWVLPLGFDKTPQQFPFDIGLQKLPSVLRPPDYMVFNLVDTVFQVSNSHGYSIPLPGYALHPRPPQAIKNPRHAWERTGFLVRGIKNGGNTRRFLGNVFNFTENHAGVVDSLTDHQQSSQTPRA